MLIAAACYLSAYIFVHWLAGVYKATKKASFADVISLLVFHGLAAFALDFLLG